MSQSLLATGTPHPLYVLVVSGLSSWTIGQLSKARLPTLSVGNKFPVPARIYEVTDTPRWLKTFDKLEVFELTQFSKVIFLDGDMLVLRNIDHLFDSPHPSAAVYHGRVKPFQDWTYPNSGLLVVQPRTGLGSEIFSTLSLVAQERDSLSDQVLIHKFYSSLFDQQPGDWELSVMYNACAFLLDRIIHEHKLNFKINAPDEQTVAVVHFSSPNKPWAMSPLFLLYLLIRKIAGRKWNEIRAYKRYHHYLRRVRKQMKIV